MDDMTSRVFWLGYHSVMFITLAGVFGALPVLVTGARPHLSPRRFLATVAGGYLLAALALGFYSYYFIPSQYTRDLDFGKLPDSWSLGESHSDSLRKADTPGAVQPEEATRRRAQVERERGDFIGRWANLAAAGFVLTLGGVGATWLVGRRAGWGTTKRAPTVREGPIR